MGYKKWHMPTVNEDVKAKLCSELDIKPFLADILSARGFASAGEVSDFLENTIELSDPFLLPDMEAARERILEAVENEERIAVYGDYDADGICATAIMTLYLQSIGADVQCYIPARDGEGYGLNISAIDKLGAADVSLIITVDNGISAIDEIDHAAEKGIDVIVTDHHMPKEVLPAAVAVVDPQRADCKAPFKDFCGAGVALKLVCAMEDGVYDDVIDCFGDLAAIATIGDIVPLVSENRTMVKLGLEQLSSTQNMGLASLIDVCGLGEKKLDAETVAYTLVPRINAAGRLGIAGTALNLLISDDYEQTAVLAQQVNDANKQRQNVETAIAKDIAAEITMHPEVLNDRVLVLAKEGWHHGVIGIVAARLVERYAKPCILISIEGDTARGSGRGVEGYSMFEALLSCEKLLTRFGGHRGAGGFSLNTADIPKLKKALEQYNKKTYKLMPVNTVSIDKLCRPDEISIEDILSLECLEPFGFKNEALKYCYRQMSVAEISPMGEGKHLRIKFTKDGKTLSCVYFGVTAAAFPYKPGDVVDILATCDINDYQGKQSVSVKIKDIRPASFDEELFFTTRERYDSYYKNEKLKDAELELITPERDDVAVVYRRIREAKIYTYDIEQLAAETTSNYAKTKLAVEALQELGLVTCKTESGRNIFAAAENPVKVELDSAQTLQKLKQYKK